MPRPTRDGRRPTTRNRHSKSLHLTTKKLPRPPHDLSSLGRGLYQRVADRLGVDPTYVSRVARSERRSKIIEDVMRREVRKIVERVTKQRVGLGNKPGGKAITKNVRTKTSAKRT